MTIPRVGRGAARTVRNTNVNLLVVLHELLQTQNVTHAARRLGVSQSTVSGSLAQLRELFGDPLLLRHGRGMRPTSRALELAEDLRDAVDSLERVLSEGSFEPERSEERFVLALSDRAELLLLTPLLRTLNERAPHAALQVLPWGRLSPPQGLAEGLIDIHVGMVTAHKAHADPASYPSVPTAVPARHRSAPLFDTRLVCVVRKDHPGVGNRLGIARFCALGHVLVTEEPGATGIVDDALASMGRRRRIVARVPRYAAALEIAATTDWITTVDLRVAKLLAARYPVRLLKPPLPLPRGEMILLWHDRTHADPARAWLRERVREVGADLARRQRLSF